MFAYILCGITGISGLVVGTYYYLKLEHYNRLANILRTVVPNRYALNQERIKDYVMKVIDNLPA